MRRVALFALGSLCLTLLACSEDVDSTDVKTSGVYAEMSVVAPGDGNSNLTVDLRVGGVSSNTHLVLKGSDQLTVTAGSQSQSLSKNGNVYQATLTGDAGGTEFVVAFMRGAGDVSAPNSHATLTDPFTLMGITPGQDVLRATGATVSWVASPDVEKTRYTVSGDCLFSTQKDITDAGTLTLTSSDFSVLSGDEAKTCPAQICLERYRNGPVDSEFGEGGTFTAGQQRCIAFNSVP